MELLSLEQLLQTHDLHCFTDASTFGALPETSILWLLEKGKIRSMTEGEYVFTHGERGDSFHVILDGTISYYRYHEGRYGFIREYRTGEQIGFMTLIALHDRVGRAVAHEGTITLEIDSGVFHAFQEQAPVDFGILMMNLAREMARSLRTAGGLVVSKSGDEPVEQAGIGNADR